MQKKDYRIAEEGVPVVHRADPLRGQLRPQSLDLQSSFVHSDEVTVRYKWTVLEIISAWRMHLEGIVYFRTIRKVVIPGESAPQSSIRLKWTETRKLAASREIERKGIWRETSG